MPSDRAALAGGVRGGPQHAQRALAGANPVAYADDQSQHAVGADQRGAAGAADRHAAAEDAARVSLAADKRSASVEGTERLGAALAPALKPGDVVALSGPLGAGKTRFVAGLVHALNAGAHVRSPSFTLVNEIPGALPVFH